MDILYQRGRATGAEIHQALPDAPTYSAVRAKLRVLEEKGHVRHEEEALRYVYVPTVARDMARKSALRHMVSTFFAGSVEDTVAALLDLSAANLGAKDLERISQMIETARKQGERTMTWADFVVRGTLVLAVGFAASYAFGRASAAVRHLIWTVAFLALLALPAALRLGPQGSRLAGVRRRSHARGGGGSARARQRARPLPDAAAARMGAARIGGLVAYLWRIVCSWRRDFVAGAVRTGGWSGGRGPRCMPKRWRTACDATLGIGRSVRVLESPAAAVPMTWGTLRPVVLLPEAARDGRRSACTPWCCTSWSTCGGATCWHRWRRRRPAACTGSIRWSGWPRGNSARSAKRACDDAVLSGGVSAPDYAGHLLEAGARDGAAAAVWRTLRRWPRAGDLEERVRAVLDRGRNRAPLNRRLAATVAALACALVLPVALVTLHAQAGSGALAGVVQDISKARVPGCGIRIKNLDGKNEETATANAAGEFGFASIPAGRYSVEVRASGICGGQDGSAWWRPDAAVRVGGHAGGWADFGNRERPRRQAGHGQPGTSLLRPRLARGTPQRIPVGGNVQAAKLLSKVRPDLSGEPQAAGHHGHGHAARRDLHDRRDAQSGGAQYDGQSGAGAGGAGRRAPVAVSADAARMASRWRLSRISK